MATVICCIDFRFQDYIRKWIKKNLGEKNCDLVSWAGSTKDLNSVLKQIDISLKLHKIKKAVLIHHEDCGAYGKESTFEKHRQDLNKAKREIVKNYPNLKVNLFYLHLNGKFEKVE